jgi:ankyrin repeat protein
VWDVVLRNDLALMRLPVLIRRCTNLAIISTAIKYRLALLRRLHASALSPTHPASMDIDPRIIELRAAAKHLAGRGLTSCLERLIDADESAVPMNAKPSSAQHSAIEGGRLECVQLLLARGVDIESQGEIDDMDLTPLAYADYRYRAWIAAELLDRGADPTAPTPDIPDYAERNSDSGTGSEDVSRCTLLYHFLRHRDTEIVELLLGSGMLTNENHTHSPDTPFLDI